MITLHPFTPALGLPDATPCCMKVTITRRMPARCSR